MSNALTAHTLAPSKLAQTTQRRKLMWWHDAIIDLMLAHPEMKKGEIAKKLGRAESTISIICNSDVFRHRLAARRKEFSEQLNSDIVTNTTRVANKALEMVMGRLESGDAVKIPTLQLFSMADKALERLGFGPKPGGAVVINNQQNTVIAPTDAVAAAQQEILRREREAVERQKAAPVRIDPGPNVIDLDSVTE